MQLVVFAHRRLRPRGVTATQTSEATGLLGLVPNKGGICAVVDISGMRLGFISAHLAAHAGAATKKRKRKTGCFLGWLLRVFSPLLFILPPSLPFFSFFSCLLLFFYRSRSSRARALAGAKRQCAGDSLRVSRGGQAARAVPPLPSPLLLRRSELPGRPVASRRGRRHGARESLRKQREKGRKKNKIIL